jgi:hypothetical protein
VFFIGIIVLGVLGLIVKESFSGKGVADYQDKFEEIGKDLISVCSALKKKIPSLF